MTASPNVVCPTFHGPTVGRTPNLPSPTVAKVVMAKILRGKRSEKLVVLGVRSGVGLDKESMLISEVLFFVLNRHDCMRECFFVLNKHDCKRECPSAFVCDCQQA